MRGFLGCLVGAVIWVGCGGGTTNRNGAANNTSSTASLITIAGFSFSPPDLLVAPGSLVTVKNMDTAGHSVTSESATDLFAPGAVDDIQFDTGVFTGTRSFNIPATATAGTVIPYYCSVHKGMMKTRGTLTIVTDPGAGVITGTGGPY